MLVRGPPELVVNEVHPSVNRKWSSKRAINAVSVPHPGLKSDWKGSRMLAVEMEIIFSWCYLASK